MLIQFGNNWIQNIPLTAKLDEALHITALIRQWSAFNNYKGYKIYIQKFKTIHFPNSRYSVNSFTDTRFTTDV